MVLTAYYSYKAAELNRKVAEWLERHGADVDALSDGSGCGFEELTSKTSIRRTVTI